MAIKKGNSLANSIVGTSLADQLFGFGGNDTLTGGAGNDLLDGGTETDRMSGGAGDDTYVVDRSTDTVIESTGQGTDTVRSSVSLTIGVNVEHLVLIGSANANGTLSSSTNEIGNSITGNGGANRLNGGLGHDVLSGGLGSDILIGGNGNDTLRPGAGNGVADTINGGNGFDTVDYRDALSGVTVDLGAAASGGGAFRDSFVKVESVVGSRFADDLRASDDAFSYAFGGGGNDIIRANDTAVFDRLRGDDGNDALIGGPGGLSSEDFVLQYDRGLDIVQQFIPLVPNADHILIDDKEFGLSLTGPTRTLQNGVEFGVINTAPVSSASFSSSQRLLYDTSSRVLWADKDGSGSAFAPVTVAVFASTSSAPGADFIWLV